MRRREVIAGLASSAVASPLTALAQQSPERVRRVGVLMDLALNDAEGEAVSSGPSKPLRPRLEWR